MVGPEITRRLPINENLKVSYWQFVVASTFFGVSLTSNYMKRRPFSSSVLKHAASIAAGYYGGTELDKYLEHRQKMRILVLEDYISKHPEDFPITEPKKYKDILLPWIPLR